VTAEVPQGAEAVLDDAPDGSNPRSTETEEGSGSDGTQPESIIVTPAAQVVSQPAAAEELNSDSLEILLGTEHLASRSVVWAPGRQSNGFLLVLGASGSGKTETLKVLGAAINRFGVPVLTFDFHGDVVFPGTNSTLLSSGSASTVGLNPMEIDAHSAEESGLYDQRAALRAMVQRAVPSLGHRQSSILREAFEEAYRRVGIEDNDPATWTRTAPTFGQVQEILGDWADDDARKSQRSSIEGCLAAVQQLFDHPISQSMNFCRDQHV
jgi:energy-coupling factor transporter ATP-binding protein EcfA2